MRTAIRSTHLCVWLLTVGWLQSAAAIAQQPETAAPAYRGDLRVYAYTLRNQPASEALVWIRPLLSATGTVEEQPRGNTLVIRDQREEVKRIAAALARFDQPPRDLRFEIQILRAGPARPNVISPPLAAGNAELVNQLKGLLRYDSYQVLAQAAVSSREGDEVTYSLGDEYDVTFTAGTVMAEQRLRLEDFRIVKSVPGQVDKGRQLKPRELFHSTLNLWVDKPFALVLAQDAANNEALMIAISCRPEPPRSRR